MQRTLTTLLGLAVGVVMLTGPDLTSIGSDAAYNSALAAKGGNGKGNGAGSGGAGNSAQAGSKSNSGKSASAGANGKSKLDKSLNSKMGALHAANASASAFLHASKNSRVGRIREAILASAATEAAQTAYDAALATAVAAALAADPNIATLQGTIASLETQLLDESLDDATKLSLQEQLATAQDDLAAAEDAANAAALADQSVMDAQTTLDAYDAAEDSAWEAAANKTPVDDDVKAATIDLVGDKVDTSGVVVTPTTP
jgi:hypothetical protein